MLNKHVTFRLTEQRLKLLDLRGGSYSRYEGSYRKLFEVERIDVSFSEGAYEYQKEKSQHCQY